MFLNGGAGKDTLTGGTDADTLYGNGGDDKLAGNAGDDVLTGGAGNDTVSGGDGDDYLMGDAGNDRLDGGAGSDWAGYESATAAVKVDLSLTAAQNTGGGGTDTLLNIENVYGTAFADTLSGSTASNMLFGGAGDDSLSGGQGDDFLAGGAGNDTINGGAGDDTVSYDDGDVTGVVVNLATGVATGHGTDTLVSIEGVYGGAGNDTLTGSGTMANYLGGGAGNDNINATGPNSYVEGGTGDDRISIGFGVTADGGAGDDLIEIFTSGNTVWGGAGRDTFQFDNMTGVYSPTRVMDFESDDRIGIVLPSYSKSYAEGFAADIDDALRIAKILMGNEPGTILAMQIGDDVLVLQGTTTPQYALTLVGRTLADIDYSNFI